MTLFKGAKRAKPEDLVFGLPGDIAVCECLTCGRAINRVIPQFGSLLKRDMDCDDCAEAFQRAFNSSGSLELAAGDGNVH